MSRFVQQSVIGDPLELEVVDRDAPHAGPGTVRVRVHAAGLNPVDWKIGTVPEIAEAFGVRAPAGFGNDLAGVVDEVGDGVEGFEVGDRVFGGARGRAVAEHVVLEATPSQLAHTPVGLEDATAGALQIAGRTADAVIAQVRAGAGDTVLIGGAAGGVGVLAVQLAVRAGARVIASASERNHALLRELGAEPVTYGDGLAARVRALAPQGVDAAIDLHGTAMVDAAIELGVAPERIATIAAGPNPPHGAVAVGGGDATPGALQRIARDLASGALRLPIEATYPIDRIAEAVEHQRGGHVQGKIVVTI